MNVLGLDLSICATGVAYADGTRDVWRPRSPGDRRLVDLANLVDSIVSTIVAVDVVVLEDLPTHAHGAGITGMVHGAVRVALQRANVPYALVTPASLKKYATSRGNAPKPELRMQLYKRTGIDEPDDNAVDAAWLRLMGVDHYTGETVVPESHRVALHKVAWPTLTPLEVA